VIGRFHSRCLDADRVLIDTRNAGPRASITHKISSLGPSLLSKSTTLGGWLTGRRQANSTLAFFNLSDSTGQVQLVVNPKDHPSGDVEQGKRLIEELMRVPLHSVVQVEGTVKSKLAAKKVDQQVSFVVRYCWVVD
jgi:aspartyl-tRNA synthetase